MIKLYDVHVRTNGSILHLTYISRCVQNIQHYMSANKYYNNISIDNYKGEIFLIFLFALYVHFARSFTPVYLEVIDNIQCQNSTSKTQFKKNKCQVILSENVLVYLVHLLCFGTDVYIDDIVNMICQINKYFIQQQHDQNFRHLC